MSVSATPLFLALARAVDQRVADFAAQDLANIAWAFAKAGRSGVPWFAACAGVAKRRMCMFTLQGLANTADWNDIDQQVGTLADQIVAKIC